jgi:CheY-like chemotaxis protein
LGVAWPKEKRSAGAVWPEHLGAPDLDPGAAGKSAAMIATPATFDAPASPQLPAGLLQRAWPAIGDALNRPEVLVLDADPSSRHFLRTALHDFGFDVHASDDVAQGWALVVSHSLAACFVDTALRLDDGGDGIDLCRHFHESGETSMSCGPPVVAIAGHLRPADRLRTHLASCFDVLLRPVTRDTLARALEVCGIATPWGACRA